MPVRSSGLALLAVASIVVALTACSSSGTGKADASATGVATRGSSTSPSPAASTSAATTAAAIPTGYQRVGGSAQGISLAVPNSWVSVNLAKQTIASAFSKLDVPGVNASALKQDMQSLQKTHAIFAVDVASATSNPNHFARNLDAYCGSSGITETGSASIPYLTQVAKSEFGQLGKMASVTSQEDAMVGGVPGIEISYKLNSADGAATQGAQLDVLPKPDVFCFVTLSFSSPQSQGNYLAVAAATAQFP
jgi:hypothetical protein